MSSGYQKTEWPLAVRAGLLDCLQDGEFYLSGRCLFIFLQTFVVSCPSPPGVGERGKNPRRNMGPPCIYLGTPRPKVNATAKPASLASWGTPKIKEISRPLRYHKI